MLAAFHFEQPYWLLLSPFLIALGYLWLQRGKNTRQFWSQVCDPALLPFLVKDGQVASKNMPLLMVLVSVLLAVAAAQPVWKQQPAPSFKQGGSLVIALDLSASMNATDIKPSRIQRAHFKIEDLLGRLGDSQVALLVYAGDAFVVTPLTEDTGTILAQLSAMVPDIMPSQGSRADRAITQANDMLDQAGVRGGGILLISDEVEPAQIAAQASRLAKQGRQLSILAVGSAQGAPIPTQFGSLKDRQGQVVLARTNMEQMREAAALGQGIAVKLENDESDLSALLAALNTGERELVKSDIEVERWVAEGPWFVLLALPLLLPLFRRGMLALLLPLVCVMGIAMPQDATAGVWQDLWTSADQQAAALYQAGDKERAAQTFSDPRWKQVSQYEAKDYAAALDSVAEPETAADWYNRGNILAQQQQLDDAIAAFDRALAKQPDHKDAAYNKQLLLDFKKQQEQQEKQKQDKKDKQKQDSQNKGSEKQEGQNGQQEKQQSDQSQDKQDSEQQESAETKTQQNQQSKDSQESGSAQSSEQGGRDEKNSSAETPSQAEQAQNNSQSEPPNKTAEQAKNAEAKQADAQQKAANYLKQQMDKNRPDDGQAPAGISSDQPSGAISESEQARQQLLNRIVDDPAGLWRRKFIYQYRQRAETDSGEEKTW